MSSNSQALIDVSNLKVHFPITKGLFRQKPVAWVKAVDGITFSISRGETLGLVGESGCGKSTAGRALLQLIQPTAGQVSFDGEDITQHWQSGNHGKARLRQLRQRMQIIFQDPYASLNPRMTVEDIIAEPLRNFKMASGSGLRRQVQDLMAMVGMDPRYIRRYPHEFSGGQRQRIGIARALALKPEFIVADEPISALDVSIQAQILNLLKELQRELKLTYLFIAHDLAAVRHISDRIAVMYLGHVVEIAKAQQLYDNPKHPYTKALMSAVPLPDPVAEKKRHRIVLQGDVPSPINPPSGCPFHTRCPEKFAPCDSSLPMLQTAAADQQSACHLNNRN